MRIKDLLEEVDKSYYMEEGCGIFAIALSKLCPNGKIYIFSNKDDDAEEWDDNVDFEITHVVYYYNDSLYDVTGETSINRIKESFHINKYSMEGPYNPDYFFNNFMGLSDDKPIYGSIEDINEAINFIKNINYLLPCNNAS